MKTLLFTATLLFSLTALHAQDVDQIIKQDIRVQASTETVKKGLAKLEKTCEVSPASNCKKGKAFGYYILSGRYYSVANSLIGLDANLQSQAFEKASELYAKASHLLPEETLTDQQKYLLLDEKGNYEAAVK